MADKQRPATSPGVSTTQITKDHPNRSVPVTITATFLGGADVGKTSLLRRYLFHAIPSPTFAPTGGLHFAIHPLRLRDHRLLLHLYDLGSQHPNLLPICVEPSHVIIYCFDLTRPKETLRELKTWFEQAQLFNQTAFHVLVGCKFDQFSKEFSLKEQKIVGKWVKKYAHGLKASIVFTSAVDQQGGNVSTLFRMVVCRALGLKWNTKQCDLPGEPWIVYNDSAGSPKLTESLNSWSISRQSSVAPSTKKDLCESREREGKDRKSVLAARAKLESPWNKDLVKETHQVSANWDDISRIVSNPSVKRNLSTPWDFENTEGSMKKHSYPRASQLSSRLGHQLEGVRFTSTTKKSSTRLEEVPDEHALRHTPMPWDDEQLTDPPGPSSIKSKSKRVSISNHVDHEHVSESVGKYGTGNGSKLTSVIKSSNTTTAEHPLPMQNSTRSWYEESNAISENTRSTYYDRFEDQPTPRKPSTPWKNESIMMRSNLPQPEKQQHWRPLFQSQLKSTRPKIRSPWDDEVLTE